MSMDQSVRSTELAKLRERLPGRAGEVQALGEEIDNGAAVLAAMRQRRVDLRKQVEVLRRVVVLAVEVVDRVDEMRQAGELAEHGGDRRSSGAPRRLIIEDLGLSDRRVREWRKLRDDGAVPFLDDALADDREATFEKASMRWLLERVARIAREQLADERRAQPVEPISEDDLDIRCGDFRDELRDLTGTVDAIITDPPYPAEYLPLYDDLAEHAASLLKPTGLLAAMVGQSHLPECIRRLGSHLAYRWCGAYLTDGPATRIHAAKVGTKWKPILIFGGERFITEDVFASDAEDKQHHGWGQSESGTAAVVKALTEPGDLVLDPFLGGGTTAVVCRELGRRFVGCDIDADAVAAASERLAG